MNCEITTYSTNSTPNQQLLYSFGDTGDTTINFIPNYNKTILDISQFFPDTDYSSDSLKKEIKSESYELMLASEKVLSKDWNSPEEDEAWADL